MNISEVSDLVKKCHLRKDYRPVVVAIIQNLDGQVLLVQSAKATNDWSMPQGGIEQGEHFLTGLFREIRQETGLLRLDYAYQGCLDYQDLDFPPDRQDKRGFTRGKRYFFCQVLFDGDPSKVVLQPEELSDYRWATAEETISLLTHNRPEKTAMIKRVLTKAGILFAP